MTSIALRALLARVPIKHSDEAEEFVPEKKLSPLEAARKAVRKGDMDGDWSLNELEFKTQMLRDAQFRSAVFAALDIDEVKAAKAAIKLAPSLLPLKRTG